MGGHDLDRLRASDVFFALADELLVVAGFDGRFQRLNPAWTEALGWTTEELCSEPWLSFVHPDDLEATVAAGDTLQGGATLTHFSNRYRCRDGAYRRLEWQCVPSVPRQLIYGVVRLVPEPPAVPVSVPGGPGGSRTRVLIVDDQSAVALTMGRVLRHHDVTAVAHGPEALALLAAGRTFDVILSDLSSPVMPGPAFYAALVRHFPEAAARLAFVTGGAHTPEAQAFLSAAPHPCLEKPFHPEQLCALVEAVSQ
ncbi:MAG: response regulator [Myxococcaceae bacterium]|nr:MAG: response regulator [Myxococcaceae bacterium]